MLFRSHIGSGRIGHDGGGVAVDQNNPVALLAQRLAGLHAGVVELAGLANNNRASADDEDGLNVCAFRHDLFFCEANFSAAVQLGAGRIHQLVNGIKHHAKVVVVFVF